MNLYAIIMAGGEGKRFWPLSTKERPKQFLKLLGDKSLIRQTVDRVLPLIPIENIFIVTIKTYAEETLKHLPELPPENLILEPVGRNTGPCIAYGSLKISALDPDSVTVVLPADHAIGNEDEFRRVLRFACEASNSELEEGGRPLITLGVKPLSPETGYGYIKAGGREVISSNGLVVLNVLNFTEKPDAPTAREFLNDGDYFWNSGMFVWKTSSILEEFDSILPEWSGYLSEISADLGKPRESESVSGFYSDVESGSIDELILERSQKTLVIPVDFPWSDVGSWKALYDYLSSGDENILRGNAITLGSSSCMIMGSERTVALVGVSDLVVVDTRDALLVLNRDSSQEVKKILEELGKLGNSD